MKKENIEVFRDIKGKLFESQQECAKSNLAYRILEHVTMDEKGKGFSSYQVRTTKNPNTELIALTVGSIECAVLDYWIRNNTELLDAMLSQYREDVSSPTVRKSVI